MSRRHGQSGLSLTEMAVAIAAIALLMGIALPVVKTVMDSFESGHSAKSMISSALASARALAVKEGHYVGVRFQMAYDPDAADPLDCLMAPQYMTFIVHDTEREPNGTGLANGFRALEGAKPIRLPESVGVMDLMLVDRIVRGTQILFTEYPVDSDAAIDSLEEVRETTTFSVIFSPSGKMLMHEVRVRNRNGRRDSDAAQSLDEVFNTETQVANPVNPVGLFYQDDYLLLGLGPEYSRSRLFIYDRVEFARAYERGQAWSGYLAGIAGEAIHINPYMGTLISRD